MKCIPVFLLCATAVFAQKFANSQAARLVVGQPNGFTAQDTNSSNTTIGGASGIAVVGDTLFVADSNRIGATPSNNRVLIFTGLSSQLPTPTAQLAYANKCPVCVGTASVVLGQPDFVTTTVNNTPTQNSLRNPQGVASDGIHLVVADTDDNRVLIWNSIPTANNQNADVVIGQANFISNTIPGNTPNAKSMRGPEGVWIQNGKLFVADTQNNRVLIYNQIPTSNGVAADVVLGAPNFSTYVNPDISQQLTGATASTMLTPVSVTSDGTRLFVTDLGFNRVLIFNSIPTTNGAPADVALGQPDLVSSIADNAFTGSAATSSTDTGDKEVPVLCKVQNGIDLAKNPTYPAFCSATLSFPRYALDVGGRTVVADGGNDRLLVWDQTPPTTGSAPDIVIGQVDGFSDVASANAESLATPTALAWDGANLFVSDTYNRRINVYTVGATSVAYQGIRNAASLDITATGTYSVLGAIQAGDVITLTVNTYTYTYTVLTADTVQTVATALVNLLNSANNGAGDPAVSAAIDIAASTSAKIQIDLTSKLQGDLGNNVTYSVTVTPATNQTIAKIIVTAGGTALVGGGAAAKVAPGTVVSVLGTNLSAGTVSADTKQPQLPTELGGTQVYFNGIQAPLFYVSPTLINAQVPWELGDQTSVSAFVRSVMADGSIMYTSAVGVTIVPANPGLYSTGNGNPPTGVVYHASSYATAVVSVDGGPSAGGTASFTVNGRKYSYTASAIDTLDSIRNALLVQLNQDPQVTASIAGVFDRIILKARVAGPQGNGIPITASASGGSLVATALDSQTCCSNIAGAQVTPTNPAVPGELLTLFATGLGLPYLTDQVQPLIQTGVQFPLNGPTTVPQSFVSSTAGGSTADVLQATMQPGTVGGNQVLLHLNSNLISSDTTLVNIAQGNFTSNEVTFPLVSPNGNSALDPRLVITSTHSGNFYQGQQNAWYTLTITNQGGGNPSSGLVTVTETLPTGMTLVQMIGDGWSCSGNVCTRSDALAATVSYPTITVIVNVASTATSPLTNTAKCSGGGSATTTSTDATAINTTAPSNPPKLTLSKTHTGNFTHGQQNATYTITVSNAGGASSSNGVLYVDEVLPTGLTLVSMAGTGWTCVNDSCSRTDALGGGSTFPVITVTVDVASNAPASVTNMAVVSGGGSAASVTSNPTNIQQ